MVKPSDVSDIRNALLARFNDSSFGGNCENIVAKLSFTDKNFAMLPITFVVKDLVQTHPRIAQRLSSYHLERCVFLILQTFLHFHKKLDTIDMPVEKLDHLAKLANVELITPFTGFVLKSLDGRYIRVKQTPSSTTPKNSDLKTANEKKRTHSQMQDDPGTLRKLHMQQKAIAGLEKKLKETDRNYAATVEENDALQDELETATLRIQALSRNNNRERKSMVNQLIQYEQAITMLQFEIAEVAEKAPETQALLVTLSADRDKASAEAKKSRCQLEEYDRYMKNKMKEFKNVARLLIGRHRVSEAAKAAVQQSVEGDLLACRASAWAKEKEQLLRCIKDKEETETAIEAEGMMCLCQHHVKRAKLVCGHSLCTICIDKVDICPYCRAKCEVSHVFEP